MLGKENFKSTFEMFVRKENVILQTSLSNFEKK